MWEWLSNNATALQGLGGAAAVVAAAVAIFALMRAGLDSASRTRPYIVVEYRVPEFAYRRIDLVVKNAGPTAAREVQVEFTPAFQDSTDGGDLGAYAARRYAQAIDALGPGQEFVSILHIDLEDPEKSDVPPVLAATVTYSPRSAARMFRRYRDTFTLQTVAYTEQVFSESSDSLRKQIKRIADSMGKIEGHVQRYEVAVNRVITSLGPERTPVTQMVGGVAWQLQPVAHERFALYNTGEQPARHVDFASDDRIQVRLLDGEPDEVRPGEALELMFLFRGGSHSTRLTVSWDSEGAERHGASVMIPVWVA